MKQYFKYAAGMLLFSIHNNEVYVLLGKDQYGFFSDFGGRNEMHDQNEIDTASRECYEETCGTVESIDNLKLISEKSAMVTSETYYKRPYYMYISQITHDKNVPYAFNKIQNHLRKISNLKAFKEKASVEWIQWNSVKNEKIALRNMFKITLFKNLKDIELHMNNRLKNALYTLNRKVPQRYGRQFEF